MNGAGQTAVPAFFVFGVLVLGILLSWPVISSFLTAASSSIGDSFITLVLSIGGVAVLAAAGFGLLVWMGVGSGR